MRGTKQVYARLILGALLTALFLPLWAHAQIERVEWEDLPADAVTVGYLHGFLSQRTNWGILYTAGGGGSIGLRDLKEFVEINIGTPPPFPLLSNEPPEGSDSSGLPLVIDFAFPVRKVEMGLVSGRVDVNASIRALDSEGNLLGELEGIEVESSGGVNMVGVGTSAPQAISKLILDYGDSPQSELVHFLRVEFRSRPTFRTVIPQVARGDLERGGRLETSIAIVSFGSQVSGEIRFFGQNGQLLPIAGESSIPLSPLAYRGQFVETSDLGAGEFQGYAVIDSDGPIVASATYRATAGDGTVLSEAGVAGTSPSVRALGNAVELRRLGTVSPGERTDDLRTALAVVNLSDQPAHVIVRLDSGDVSFGAYRDLPPHGQFAGFLAQLFGLENAEARGALTVVGDQSLAVTTLQTRDGLPVASLPLAVADP